ncbi:MAG: hypothetical protein RR998_01980 [Oscillospiraceae bacterium]
MKRGLEKYGFLRVHIGSLELCCGKREGALFADVTYNLKIADR